MVVCVYLNQYAKFLKMIQIKFVDLIEIHIFCFMHFFLRLIFSEKISDTFDIEFELRKNPHRVPVSLIPFNLMFLDK